MFVPGCLTSHRGFSSWDDAQVFAYVQSQTCHPYVCGEGRMWIVHYIFALTIIEDP